MKALIFSGSHSRHLFINRTILDHFQECAVVMMERENLQPTIPDGILSELDKKNFRRHFLDRFNLEKETFGELDHREVFSNLPTFFCNPSTLNSSKTVDFVKKFSPDFVFIFGTDLIKGELLNILPSHKINLHLGLSPWYRGSATLFWPFYFLQPQFAGATFHQIVPEADAGDIVHQSVPKLFIGDGIHDVGVRTVETAREDLIKILDLYKAKREFKLHRQKTSGRLFLSNQFHFSHLRVIYNLYNNNIVDSYLKGDTTQSMPNLIRAL